MVTEIWINIGSGNGLFTYLKFYWIFPGANEVIHCGLFQCSLLAICIFRNKHKLYFNQNTTISYDEAFDNISYKMAAIIFSLQCVCWTWYLILPCLMSLFTLYICLLVWDVVKSRNRLSASFNLSPPSAAYMRQWIGSALVQIMACRLFSAKPLSKPMLGYCQLDPWEKNFSEIITNFSFTKMQLKISSAKRRPFCPGRDELTHWDLVTLYGLSLTQVMAGCLVKAKPLCEPMLTN